MNPVSQPHGNDEQEEDGLLNGIFQEPEGYYEVEGCVTFQQFSLALPTSLDNHSLPAQEQAEQQVETVRPVEFNVRLIAKSPLWGHLLFPASRYISEYLAKHETELVRNKTILELGAGSGLPSLVCAYCGANTVVLTDYPDANLLENLQYNIDHCAVLGPEQKGRVKVIGHVWGSSVERLVSELSRPLTGTSTSDTGIVDQAMSQEQQQHRIREGFDTLILADLVFNHSEHAKLLSTVRDTLAYTKDARALVFFTPHRPWLYEADLEFFSLATSPPTNDSDENDEKSTTFRKRGRLGARKIVEDEHCRWTMFEEDKARDRIDHPEDKRLRSTVFGYELFWEGLE